MSAHGLLQLRKKARRAAENYKRLELFDFILMVDRLRFTSVDATDRQARRFEPQFDQGESRT
jgi:hypothetical protein